MRNACAAVDACASVDYYSAAPVECLAREGEFSNPPFIGRRFYRSGVGSRTGVHAMKFTVRAEALVICVEAGAGRVYVNGAALLPHEAELLSATLSDAADEAETIAARVAAQPVKAE